MDLGRLNRDAEDRSVVWAAVVTAALGVATGLFGVFAHLNGQALDARIQLAAAIVYCGLAFGIYRGSRAAAVAVVTLYLLNAALSLLAFGLRGVGLMTIILGAVLWAGMRGVFAQAARAPRTASRPGHSA
ncbi:MAG TPA: hypothetical protein VFT45_12675 [Longimicrobium sp.]|nr:hypothetical protein [Longimicrobium sp.]